MTARHDDTALLDLLGDAIAPRSAEPTAAEVNALRFAVEHPRADAPGRRGWLGRPVMIAAATTAAVLIGSTAVATAMTGDVPSPVRSVARVVGIPVDDSDEDDAPVTTTTSAPTAVTPAPTPTTVHVDNSGPGSVNSGRDSVGDGDVDNSGPGGGGDDKRPHDNDNSGPGSQNSGSS